MLLAILHLLLAFLGLTHSLRTAKVAQTTSSLKNVRVYHRNNILAPDCWTFTRPRDVHPVIKKAYLPASLLAIAALFPQGPVYAAGTTAVESISRSGFVQSSLLIFVSEVGDKTFFIAGLLAAKYGRSVAFLGALSALTVMTVLSTVIGQVFHAVPSSLKQGIPFDDYVAVLAFAYFGIKTLMDARNLPRNTGSTGVSEEQKEAEAAVALAEEREKAVARGGSASAPVLKTKKADFGAQLLQTFSLVFAAEIGDRSFLSTIALSAALNPIAVAGGALMAHAAATGVAVLGGELMSKYLSERTIGFIGGTLFLVFAFTTAWGLF